MLSVWTTLSYEGIFSAIPISISENLTYVECIRQQEIYCDQDTDREVF